MARVPSLIEDRSYEEAVGSRDCLDGGTRSLKDSHDQDRNGPKQYHLSNPMELNRPENTQKISCCDRNCSTFVDILLMPLQELDVSSK